MAETGRSTTRAIAEKVIFAALQILQERGGEAPGREVIGLVEQRVELDDWARETYAKTGNVRWRSVLHFYSIDCIKAGFLVKKQGIWYLTPEGETALRLGPAGLLNASTAAYRRWEAQRAATGTEEGEPEAPVTQSQAATISEIEQRAVDGLKQQIGILNAYEFQDLVAALLRGMGYFTPFVAPRGKDGGVDITAYRDPLGTVAPRIKAQIKHRDAAASVMEVRQLMGLLQKDGDVGIFVSTSGFSPDAKSTARSSAVHVEMIDLDRFIALWREFYPRMMDEDKALLPLIPI